MRVTCLKCGHQLELSIDEDSVQRSCVCGQDHTNPQVVNTGTCPNERAAERSRYRAFQAAGLVKNIGGVALGLSLLAVIFFPLGIVGAAVGLYVLATLRGPVGRFSGRRAAGVAVVLGLCVFVGEGVFAVSWYEARHRANMMAIQATAVEDLRALLRAQRLFRASRETYGTFNDFRFQAPYGSYTLYLGADDRTGGIRDGNEVADPLPPGFEPAVGDVSFTAVAVANLDSDEDLDVWIMTEAGDPRHAVDDVAGD